MNFPKHLGEIVRRDRGLAGLTQDQLVIKLNKVKDFPIDPFTKKPKRAHRSWIAKLESGSLSRELRVEVRQWLASALGGDSVLYKRLAVNLEGKNSIPDDFDVLPLVKRLAQSKKSRLTFDKLSRFF